MTQVNPVPGPPPHAETTGPYASLRSLLGRIRSYRKCDTPTAADYALSLACFALEAPGDAGGGRWCSAAVLGPTQVGKSTLVNLLIGQRLAGVSPLAGFTRRPEGFALRPAGSGPAPQTPDTDVEDVVHAVEQPAAWLTRPWILWDTPDFDTLSAGQYRDALLRVVARADALLFVLSAEKYADRAVWELLDVIARLGRPVAFVLNKLPPAQVDDVAAAFRSHVARHQPALAAAAGRAVCIPLTAALARAEPADELSVAAAVGALWSFLRDAPARGASALGHDVAQLARVWWSSWVAPICAEHAAREAFRARVAQAGEALIERYRSDFLDDPRRYDTLHRMTLELLKLLEVPRVAELLSRTRRVLTWPMRTVAGHLSRAAGRGPRPAAAPGSEPTVLRELIEQLLVELTRFALHRSERDEAAAPFWRGLCGRLMAAEPALRRELEARILQHHESFEAQIRQAAHDVHARLRENPALLHALRAGRLGADVAAVVVAFKTAGTGLGELLLTPAVLSLTSALTEGAMGAYIRRVEAELKRQQLEHLRRGLLERELLPRLHALADDLEAEGVWNVPAEQLEAARRELDALEQADGD